MSLLKGFRFLKFTGKCYGIWPLEDGINKIWCILYACLWWFYFINDIVAATTTILTCYHARNDFIIACFSWMEFMVNLEIFIVLVNYKYYQNILKSLLMQLEDYLVTADEKRRCYLEEKIAIFKNIILLRIFFYLTLLVLYKTYPVETTWESFLMTTYYPPWIRSTLLDVLIYVNQIVVMIHSSAMVNVDAIVVLLIYICSTRLKILASHIQTLDDQPDNLQDCIREHQSILNLAEKTNRAVRVIISKTIIAFVLNSVGAGLQITNPKATLVSMERFGIVFLINCLRLILHGTCVNHLITVSNNIAFTVYSTLWYHESRNVVKTKQIIMTRSQKVLKIHVPIIMPTMDLPFITKIIATSVSYFTTLYTMIEK